MVEVAPPSPPLFVSFSKTSAGDQLDDAIQQLDIFQLDANATSFSLAIYRLLELVMTPLDRQIDDLNLHSPLSLVLKRWSVSELHSLTCQFLCHSDVELFYAWHFGGSIGVLISDVLHFYNRCL